MVLHTSFVVRKQAVRILQPALFSVVTTTSWYDSDDTPNRNLFECIISYIFTPGF